MVRVWLGGGWFGFSFGYINDFVVMGLINLFFYLCEVVLNWLFVWLIVVDCVVLCFVFLDCVY